MQQYIYDKEKGKIKTIIKGEVVYLTEEEVEKIQNGCLYQDGQIIETEDYKQNIYNQKLKEINTGFDETIKNYIKNYPEMEVQTWAIKLAEAEKVLAGQDSPYLTQLAEDKGLDVNELTNKIKAKADVYNAMYSKLEAEKDRKIQELKQNLEIN